MTTGPSVLTARAARRLEISRRRGAARRAAPQRQSHEQRGAK